MMKNLYFGLVGGVLAALFITCVILAKDGIAGDPVNCIIGYLGAFGCLYLTLRSIDWIIEEQGREKRRQRR